MTNRDNEPFEPGDEGGATPAGAEATETLAATLGAPDDVATDEATGPKPLAQVRYGLGKELLLYEDEIAVVSHEEATELRLTLDNVRRLILAPGDPNPSKLILMFDLDDDSTIIAAEGMSNVRDFRVLLARLHDLRPEIEFDPANMDEQLAQALEIRRRSMIGCYGVVVGAALLLWVIYLVVAYIGAHSTPLVH